MSTLICTDKTRLGQGIQIRVPDPRIQGSMVGVEEDAQGHWLGKSDSRMVWTGWSRAGELMRSEGSEDGRWEVKVGGGK